MIVQVEFDAFTKAFDYLKEQPSLLQSKTARLRKTGSTKYSSSKRRESSNTIGLKRHDLKVAG